MESTRLCPICGGTCTTSARFCRKCGGQLPVANDSSPASAIATPAINSTVPAQAGLVPTPSAHSSLPAPSVAQKIGVGAASLIISYAVCGMILALLLMVVGKSSTIGSILPILWLIIIPAAAITGYRWWMRTRYGGN